MDRHVSGFKQFGQGPYGDLKPSGAYRRILREVSTSGAYRRILRALSTWGQRRPGMIGGAPKYNTAKGKGKRKPALSKGQQTIPFAFGNRDAAAVSPPSHGTSALKQNQRWAVDSDSGVKYRLKDPIPGEGPAAISKCVAANHRNRKAAMKAAGFNRRDGRCNPDYAPRPASTPNGTEYSIRNEREEEEVKAEVEIEREEEVRHEIEVERVMEQNAASWELLEEIAWDARFMGDD